MNLKEKINTFEKVPGVYLMKDIEGNIVYVGKSKSLRDRVKSYFTSSNNHSRKIQRMVKLVQDIEIIKTDTELDALLLECKMIKEIKPIYNKLMKNDENYVYLKIDTKRDYPYIECTHKINDDSYYFGPYALGKKADKIIEIISHAYKIRSCKKLNKCFKYDLKHCIGPCRDIINIDDYNDMINQVMIDLNNNMNGLINILNDNMQNEILNLNFEKASNIKDDIDIIVSLSKKQDIINKANTNKYILANIKINNKYKVYVIYKGILINSDIISEEEYISLNYREYYKDKLLSFDKEINDNEKSISKYEIDFINIIYSYIKVNNISHIVYKNIN